MNTSLLPRRAIALAFALSAPAAFAWPTTTQVPWAGDLPWQTAALPPPTGCDSLTGDPIRVHLTWEGDIQDQVDNVCETCHVNNSSGGLSLRFDVVRENLMGFDESGQQANGYPEYKRVVPGDPLSSLLFRKLNCDNPTPPLLGGRMPATGALPTDFQALVHDWIALGAIFANGDRNFLGNFEDIR
jgi:hypothetical protein